MKFCKLYTEYIQGHQTLHPGLSFVEFKRLKKLLKKCPHHDALPSSSSSSSLPFPPSLGQYSSSATNCPSSCSVCDCTFFPVLMKEIMAVSGCFNTRAQKLLQFHLASGLQKYFLRLRYKHADNHLAMIEEGKSLLDYLSINAVAIRKILKKYDKVHLSRRGRAFKSRLQAMHVELLQSPWLIELIAFQLNLKDSDISFSEICTECLYDFESNKPTISCTLQGAGKLEIDLTCSICLEMVFDPVCLRCGHIFCFSCACSAASASPVEGLKVADKNSKCPLCRQARVYPDAVRLTELATLISTRHKEYWDERLQRERTERLRQIKEHWDQQCRKVMGL